MTKRNHETAARKMAACQTRRRQRKDPTPNASLKQVKTKPPRTRDDRNQHQTQQRNTNQRSRRGRGETKRRLGHETPTQIPPRGSRYQGGLSARPRGHVGSYNWRLGDLPFRSGGPRPSVPGVHTVIFSGVFNSERRTPARKHAFSES